MPRSQDILSNPNRVTLTKKIKKSNIWDKIHRQFSCLPALIFEFYSKIASLNSMQKKEDKVGNETVYKEGRQRKNTESETEKDRNRS